MINKQSPLILLVLQTTSFCNINCKYCYLPHRNLNEKFDLDIASMLLPKLYNANLLNSKLHINWHAGEPLVLPIDYYKSLVKIIDSSNIYGVEITYSLQTNCTLLNQNYCDFLKEYNVSVGVSIDGPRFLNDLNRLTRKGKSTFDMTVNGIEVLNKNDIDYSTIVVLSEKSLNYPKEIYETLHNLKCKLVGFNVEEIEGCNTSTSMNFSTELEQKYHIFLSRFNDLVIQNKYKIEVREIQRSVERLLYQDEVKNGLTTPFSTITVASNGDFTVYSPELLTVKDKLHSNYIFGNFKTFSYNEIIGSDKFKMIDSQIQVGVENCKKNCSYFEVCGGGSPSNKLHENNDLTSTETSYCKFNIQIPTDFVINSLKK